MNIKAQKPSLNSPSTGPDLMPAHLRVRIASGAALMMSCCIALADRPPGMGVEAVIAHRGSSADRPENTLASFRRAIEAGATGGMGTPAFTPSGKVVGLLTMRSVQTGSRPGMFSMLGGTAAALLKIAP